VIGRTENKWEEAMSRYMLKAAAAILMTLAASAARADDTITIAYTGALSGPFGQLGQQVASQLDYIVELLNANGGATGEKFMLVTYDNKFQPSEALIALKSITNRNIPFVLAGAASGSAVAAALIDAVEKQNARNPDNRVVYINNGALATEFTNEKCSFWHFRFDANVEQKVLMLVRALPTETRKVYLLNQDYLFGQEVQRYSVRHLAQERPDIEISGNELIPLGKVKDFAPYVSKIKAADAQAVVTGNFGPDLSLLIKASMDAGLTLNFYTMYAHVSGLTTEIGQGGEGRVLTLQPFNENLADEQGDSAVKQWVAQFRARHDFNFFQAYDRTTLKFLQAAIEKVSSTDPLRVGRALEGMTQRDMLGHEWTMRAEDHQVLMPYYVSILSKNVKYDSEHTGLGWKVVKTYEGKDLSLPTTCKMKRPEM
jgi:branched-chain amino acid transport system substrate-binding protein